MKMREDASFGTYIRNVVILGSGVMGSQIAAQCVNAGLNVTLLDLHSGDDKAPNRITEDAVARLKKMKPAPLAITEWADRIRVGNFTDHLSWLSEADWICEVVVERMEIKQDLMAKILQWRRAGSIVSSNTSGLPISEIVEGVSEPDSMQEGVSLEELKYNFLGTHFFNPPRYMKLLEIIPTPWTSEVVVATMSRFCERTLGKGVVICEDTPNFIANRIGVFSMAAMLPWVFGGKKSRLGPEVVDYLTGTLTGYSKAATFRTADIAGLDVLAHVTRNIVPAIPNDERREVFELPSAFLKMVESGMLGNKSGKGFYQKVQTDRGPKFLVVDPESLEYREQIKPETETSLQAVVEIAAKHRDPATRLAELVRLEDETGEFLWDVHAELLCYAANRLGEITGSVESVDRAMKWGFNWELGPFERWDAIGVNYVVERLDAEGREVPPVVRKMLEAGLDSFYEGQTVVDPLTLERVPLTPAAEGAITVADLQLEGREIFGNRSVGLYDMGDGVALFEFRTPQKTLGTELIGSMEKIMSIVSESFDALVIGHDGPNFSYGANLKEAGGALQEGNHELVQQTVENFQKAALSLRNAPFPVVAAASGMVFGGGCEFMMHCDRVVAHHELYAGLVELGVGLVPAGGGTKELLKRSMERIFWKEDADPLPALKHAFKTISMAKVSESAHQAREIMFLRDTDVIVMNRDLLLTAAKIQARALADSDYQPPVEPKLYATGETGYSALTLMLYVIGEGHFATEYDLVLAERVARILTGGELSEPAWVAEEWILKLERDAILGALQDPRTHARMEHMLTKGKPLRN